VLRRLLFALALLAVPAAAQNGSFQQWCVAGGQTVNVSGIASTTLVQASYPQCSVAVFLTGTVTPATIYSTITSTPLANPFCAATDGSFLFYAAQASQYDIVLSNSNACNPVPLAQLPSPFTFWDAQVSGSGGGGGGGSGTVATCGTSGALALYLAPGNTVNCDATFTDILGLLSYGGASGIIAPQLATNGTGAGKVTLNSDGVHAGTVQLIGNTTAPTLTPNSFSLLGPNSAAFTAFGWQPPTVENGAAGILHAGAASSHISALSIAGITAPADFTATGSPSSTTFLRGDNTWATPAGGSGCGSGTTGTIMEFATSTTCGNSPIVDGGSTGITATIPATGVFNVQAASSGGDLQVAGTSSGGALNGIGSLPVANWGTGAGSYIELQGGVAQFAHVDVGSTRLQLTAQLAQQVILSATTAGTSDQITFNTGAINLQSSGVINFKNGAGVNKAFVDSNGLTLVSGLYQNAAKTVAGTCAMSAGTSCTFTIAVTYSAPICITTVQSASVIAGGCTVSGTTVTITAASSNSLTWAGFVMGNPN
jgi:hypothetical protein